MANREQEQPIMQSERAPRSYGTGGYEPVRGTTSPQVQATAVTIEIMDLQGERDHLVWSVFNTAYMNICCLGLLALVFSVKSRDRKILGDSNGAQSYGSSARAANIVASLLSIVAYIITLVVLMLELPKK
ncbi:hypothetical protein XENTR_v10010950 [Xenopus tropicalis]|uniref:Dispanin subfamily A member 2b-like n=1 Tax=Xenopus tropicalis TaxID=8364 RepID=A0A8J1JIA9_XENTR|nr:dispanin subfamily A member 2b-like [Xenopus tropicalis]KAE8606973.1 hypothetical protein XENTR_v10010950 [Xenopus tropicalis]